MNCIWEIVLKAREDGYQEEDLKFINAKIPSPYTESSFELLNTSEIESGEIEVNPLYRFAGQLGALFLPEAEGYEEVRAAFLDVLMHYIAVWDLRSGCDKKELSALCILREIEEGVYYGFVRETLLSCPPAKAKRILFYLLDLYSCKDYITAFKRALKELFPGANMYLSNENNRKVILFAGTEESVEDKKRMDMLCSLFLPLSYQVDIFWKDHFGVIGVDESMRVGSLAMY